MNESYYIDEIQDYLEDLATKNKLVAHLSPVDQVTSERRAFSRFESEEHIRAIQHCGSPNIVVVADYYGQRIGDIDDKELRLVLQVRFCCKKQSGSGDETEAINAAVKLAEKIMFQFWIKMETDFQAGCNALDKMEPDKVSWNKIDDQPWLDDYYGWDLNIPFRSYMPEHNPEDWEE